MLEPASHLHHRGRGRILGHESIRVQSICVIKHVVLGAVVQDNVAQTDVTKALRGAITLNSEECSSTVFHELKMGAHGLVVAGVTSVDFLALVQAHHVLL